MGCTSPRVPTDDNNARLIIGAGASHRDTDRAIALHCTIGPIACERPDRCRARHLGWTWRASWNQESDRMLEVAFRRGYWKARCYPQPSPPSVPWRGSTAKRTCNASATVSARSLPRCAAMASSTRTTAACNLRRQLAGELGAKRDLFSPHRGERIGLWPRDLPSGHPFVWQGATVIVVAATSSPALSAGRCGWSRSQNLDPLPCAARRE